MTIDPANTKDMESALLIQRVCRRDRGLCMVSVDGCEDVGIILTRRNAELRLAHAVVSLFKPRIDTVDELDADDRAEDATKTQ